VVKPHGVRGDVIVELVTDRLERLDPGAALDTDRGPLTVVRTRPHGGRYVVTFAGVDDRDRAESIRGLVLRARGLNDPDALWVHELIGAEVVRSDGSPVGRVDAVEASGADDLLVLDTGALVPVGFARGWDERRRLVIDPPEGLFDL
jgi:16S rRNA processing protein RimM